MHPAATRLSFALLAVWAGQWCGAHLTPRDALLAFVGATLALCWAWCEREAASARWLALGLVSLGMGAAPPQHPTEPTEQGEGIVVDIRATARGREILLAGHPERRLFVPWRGVAWLDRLPEDLRPGVVVSAHPVRRFGARSFEALSASSLSCRPARGWERGTAWLAAMRGALLGRLRARLLRGPGDRAGGLLAAALAGRRALMPHALREDMRAAGLAHLAVVSGLHVGLVLLPARRLCMALAGARSRASAFAGVAATLTLLAVLPLAPPVSRAGLAVVLIGAASLLARPGAALAVVATTALLLLLVAPHLATDISFALSVAATCAIAAAARPGTALRALMVPIAPALATWPLIVALSGRTAPWTLLANLLAAPALPVALAAGWLAVLLPERLLRIMPFVVPCARLPALWIEKVAELVALLPASGALAAPVGSAWIVLTLAAIGACVAARRARARLVLLSLAVTCCAWPLLPIARAPRAPVGLYVLDVGQGQAVLVLGARDALLVDAGDDRTRHGARAALSALAQLGVHRLDGLVLTHADRDHAGGTEPMLRALDVAWLGVAERAAAQPRLRRAFRAAARRGVPTRSLAAGTELHLDAGAWRVLSPPAGARPTGNEGSLVLAGTVGGLRVLLPGDAGHVTEERLLVAGELGRVDVLVAGHHGSRGSTGAPLLAACRPRVVAISAGQHTQHGHPHPETLSRLRQARALAWVTARAGALRVAAQRASIVLEGLPSEETAETHLERERDEGEREHDQGDDAESDAQPPERSHRGVVVGERGVAPAEPQDDGPPQNPERELVPNAQREEAERHEGKGGHVRCDTVGARKKGVEDVPAVELARGDEVHRGGEATDPAGEEQRIGDQRRAGRCRGAEGVREPADEQAVAEDQEPSGLFGIRERGDLAALNAHHEERDGDGQAREWPGDPDVEQGPAMGDA